MTRCMPTADAHVLDTLRALLDLSREIGASTDLPGLLARIEGAALHILDCERVTVFLYDARRDELYSTVATGSAEIRFSARLGIAGDAATRKTIINVPDAYADPRFNPAIDRQTGFRTRSMLTFPMLGYEGEVVGVLQVLNKRGGPFSEEDEGLAQTLSALTGVALQRQMLLDERAVKLRLERDLAVARDIQRALLPQRDPDLAGYDVAGWNKPADETGGDCYDYVPLSDGRLGLFLADASGHGIGPALMAGECRAALRALASVTDLQETLTKTNALLNADLSPGRFLTAFYGVLDPAAGRIDYVSAGHAPLLLYRRATDTVETFDATTFPLGILPFLDATPAPPVELAPGDVFVLVTDGLHEWANPGGEEFGPDRMMDVVRAHRDASAADLIRHMHEAVVAFADGTPQDDDLTAVLVKRL